MKPTKEECLEALKRLKEIEVHGDDVILLKFARDISLIEQLIDEHFKLKKDFETVCGLHDDLLKMHESLQRDYKQLKEDYESLKRELEQFTN